MSISVESGTSAIDYSGLTTVQANQILGNVKTARSELMALEALLRKDPKKALKNPKLQALMKQLGLMSKTKEGWAVNLKFLGTGGVRGLQAQLKSMRKELSQAMKGLEQALAGKQGGVPQAAAQKYGADTGAEIEKIMRDPSMSLEEKLMMLGAVIADKLEKEIEEKAEALGKAATKSQGTSGTGSGAAGTFMTMGTIAMTVLGGPAGGAAAGVLNQVISGAGSGQGTQSDKQLETQIQLLMQRMNRMTSMISNLMADDHKTKSAVIANTRV